MSRLCCILDSYGSENAPTFYKNEMGAFVFDSSHAGNKFDKISGFGVIKTADADTAIKPPVSSDDTLIQCDVIRKPDKVDLLSKTEGFPADECEETYNSLKNTGSGTLSFRLPTEGAYWCVLWTPDEYLHTGPVIDVKELLGILIALLNIQILLSFSVFTN